MRTLCQSVSNYRNSFRDDEQPFAFGLIDKREIERERHRERERA